MRDQGIPRFENDDYSPYAGSEYLAKEHSGVSAKAQRNFIGKGPRGYKRSDARIYEEVCEALKDDPTVDASDIDVKVFGGIVTLAGKARDRMEKRVAEMVVVDIPGVLDVRNEITLRKELSH